ncbi:tRNA (adenosine(37)-N6)-threonylcarbamoyltransferase complex dimerization subunit type 1 TsaB, partial [Treponema sp. R6D11]
LKASDMDAFVSTTGPGSFTGSRVGSAFVMGLAKGLGKKAYGVSSLKLLALNAKDRTEVTPVVPAGRDAYYVSSYTWNGDKLVEKEPPKRESAEHVNLYSEKVVYKVPNKWANFREEDMERIHIQYIGGQV